MKSVVFFFLILFVSLNLKAQSFAENDYKDYQQSPFNHEQWDSFVKEGFQALDKEEIDNAVEFLRKATTLGCQSPLVYFKLALGFETLQSYYSAIQYYELAQAGLKKHHPNHRYTKSFDENYGRALLMMGQNEKAMKILEKALKTSSSLWLFQLFAEHELKQGNYLRATAYYERILNSKSSELSDADRFEIFLKMARVYRNEKQESGAKRYYQKVLEMDPQNVEAKGYLNESDSNSNDKDMFETTLELLKNH